VGLPELLDASAYRSNPPGSTSSQQVLWPLGIAVLGPYQAARELLTLRAHLAEALVALCLQPGARQYRPHMTIARRATGITLDGGLAIT